jgi:hypothetical protein
LVRRVGIPTARYRSFRITPFWKLVKWHPLTPDTSISPGRGATPSPSPPNLAFHHALDHPANIPSTTARRAFHDAVTRYTTRPDATCAVH